MPPSWQLVNLIILSQAGFDKVGNTKLPIRRIVRVSDHTQFVVLFVFLVVTVHAQFTHVWLKLHSDFDFIPRLSGKR